MGSDNMNLFVTRHGQTDWNVQKKVMGRCDEPLNEKGLEQAEETRKKLLDEDIDLIICSPLIRARKTAEVINKGRNKTLFFAYFCLIFKKSEKKLIFLFTRTRKIINIDNVVCHKTPTQRA